MAIIQVGGRDDSAVYIRMKIKAASEIGIHSQHIQLPKTSTERDLINQVSKADIKFVKILVGCSKLIFILADN